MNLNTGVPVFKFDFDKVKKLYKIDSFIGEFQLLNGKDWSVLPASVYFCKTPDKSKRHKQYLALTYASGSVYIQGFTKAETNKFKYQVGIHCTNCDDVIYSKYRHDFQFCSCKESFVDGGRDYLRTNSQNQVKINLITGKMKKI